MDLKLSVQVLSFHLVINNLDNPQNNEKTIYMYKHNKICQIANVIYVYLIN